MVNMATDLQNTTLAGDERDTILIVNLPNHVTSRSEVKRLWFKEFPLEKRFHSFPLEKVSFTSQREWNAPHSPCLKKLDSPESKPGR